MDYDSFHESLKYHLGKRGYGGQALVCRHTDIPPSYLSRIMKKDRRAGVRTQRKIARFFGYGLEEFVEVGRRITLGGDPEGEPDLFRNLPEEHLVQRLTEAVRKEMQTAQRLDRAQLLYANIVENSRQLIIRFDEQMKVTFVNPACELMTGQGRETLLGRSWLGIIGSKCREQLRSGIKNLGKQGGSFSMELPGRSGRSWLHLTVTVFPREIGGTDLGQLVGFDITREVAARRKLEKLVDRLRFIQHGVEMSYVPTLWIGDRANIVYVNKAVCRLLGYTKKELEKMHVWDINPLIPRKDWPAKWAWFQSEEKVVFPGRYKTKKGEIIPVEFQVSNLKYPDGRRYNVVFVKTMNSEASPR